MHPLCPVLPSPGTVSRAGTSEEVDELDLALVQDAPDHFHSYGLLFSSVEHCRFNLTPPTALPKTSEGSLLLMIFSVPVFLRICRCGPSCN